MATIKDLLSTMIGKINEKASSWNDLEDKPFGETVETVEIVAEQTVTTEEQDGVYTADLVLTEFNPVSGDNNYTVIFDGTKYDCILKNTQAQPYDLTIRCFLGNMALIGGEDTGEPFVVMLANISGELNGMLATQAAGSYTIAIHKESETIQTLDPKYLPSTGGGVTYTDYFADGSYLYHDENYQTKVTKEELATALETSIVRIGGPYAYTYFPFRVGVSSEGRVDIITLNNGVLEYAAYYTAEHSDGPQ